VTEELTIVIGFRNRDIERVKRCLDSLERQTMTAFRLVFVDYGSARPAAEEVERLVCQYPFCDYIYSETRGYPWNRSHALNTGGRLARSPYLMTTDVDMLFPPDFLQTFMARASSDKVLYCSHLFLPQGFADWENIDSYAGKLRTASKDALGACQLVATTIFNEIRGFDEYYRYWGREDRDIHERLLAAGLQAEWLNDQTRMYHQWHPQRNFKTDGFMPELLWGSMQMHFWRYKQQLLRNDENWGRILREDDRPVFAYLDFAQNALRMNKNFLFFDEQPGDIASMGKLAHQFWQLPSGHALGINHAAYPKRSQTTSSLMRYANHAFKRLGVNIRLGYDRNQLHTFLIDLMANNRELISDYYLDFPAQDGVSVLVRA